MKISFVGALGLLAVLMTSCLEDLNDTNRIAKTTLDPRAEVPVAYSSFTIEQFLEKGESSGTIDTSGNDITLVYKKQLFSQEASAFFSIPDQTVPETTLNGIDFPFSAPGATATVSKDQVINFSTSGEKLDSVLLKKGTVHISVTSDFPADINLSIKFPSAANASSIVQTSLSYTYSGSGAGNWTDNKDVTLDGVTLDLTNGGTSFNELPFTLVATVTDRGQPLSGSNSIHVDMTIQGLTFDALFGELGSKTFNSKTDTLNVDILNNTVAGTFQPTGAKLSLEFGNEFGASIGVDLGSIGTIDNNGVQMLSGSVVSAPQNPHTINGPTLSMVGKSVASQINVDGQNSNFTTLLGQFPSFIFYQFDGTLNPSNPAAQNFVVDTSKVTIDFKAEIPLEGIIKNFAIRKTFDFDGINLDQLKNFTIHQVTINSFPIDLSAQAYFQDENGIVTDSLYLTDRSLIKAAPVDANGVSTGSTTLDRDVQLTDQQIQDIRDAHFMTMLVVINGGAGANPIKILQDNNLTIQLGIKGSVEYKL